MSRAKSLVRERLTERAGGIRFALAAFLLALFFAPLAAFDRTAPVRPLTLAGASGQTEAAANDRRTNRGVVPRTAAALVGAIGADPGFPASSSVERRFAKWTVLSGGDDGGKALLVAGARLAWSGPNGHDLHPAAIGGAPPGSTRSHHFLTRAPPALAV